MFLERLHHKLVCVALVLEDTDLAQDLPLNVAHISLGDQSAPTKIIALKHLLEDHLKHKIGYEYQLARANLNQNEISLVGLTKSL